MKKYEVLEHKADLRVRVFGKKKEELFENALLAMVNSLRPKVKNQKAKPKNIKIVSSNLETMLVDFLSEVLYLIQANKEVYKISKFIKFTEPSITSEQAQLKAELCGRKVGQFGKEIKAVTYHDLEVKQNPNGFWEAAVLFDI